MIITKRGKPYAAPIIYWLEGHARFAERFAEVFHAAESGDASIVISTVTLAEVLAGPIASVPPH